MTEVGADPPAEVAAAVEGAGDEVKEDDEKASEVTSEKITSVLEAANALTSLGDEEEEGESRKADSKEIVKEEKEETKEKVEDESEVKDEKSEPILEAVKPPATVELNTVKDPPELPVEPPDEEKPPLKEEAIAGEVPGPGSLPKDDTPPKEEIEEDDAAASKRYLPEHKKPDAAPTFPEKMMAMMKLADEHKDDETYCAAWLPEGRSFVIRNPDEFVRTIVPQFFKATKFSSFTRKLYRWGFRQINRGIGPDDMIIFGNEFFDRDNEELMSKMRSITAAGTRKSETRVTPGYGKRSHDSIYDGNNDEQKRFFELMQHSNKNPHFMHPNAHIYGGGMVNDNSGMHIMRPPGGGMGGNVGGMDPSGSHHHQQMMGMNKSYDMMHQGGPNQPMPMMNNQYNANGMQLMQPQQSMPNPGNNNQGYNGGGQGYSGNAQGNNPGYNGNNQGYNGQNQGYIGNNQGYNGNNQGYSGNNQGYTNNGNNSNASGGGGGGGSGGSGNGGGNGSGNNQSTSEIVNAAIRALQFST